MNINDISFLIIGATKSATTWLQRSLQQHPRIYMPDPELHYFSRQYDRGEDWYLSQFSPPSGSRHIGEKSNSYLEEPQAASRIRAAIKDVRLIAQLRNPVERAYSDYCMLLRRGEVTREIGLYLDPRHGAGGRFLQGGLYHQQLSRFADQFPRDQLEVMFFENIKTDPAGQLRKAASFVGLGDSMEITPLSSKVKDREVPVLSPTARLLTKPFKPILAPFRNTSIVKGLRSFVARAPEYPALSQDIRNRMVDFFQKDTENLGDFVGMDLYTWLAGSKGGSVIRLKPKAVSMTQMDRQ